MYENNQYPNEVGTGTQNQANTTPNQTNTMPNQANTTQNQASPYGTYGSAAYSNYNFGSKEANQGTMYGSVPPLSQAEKARREKTVKKGPSKAAGLFKKALLCAGLGLFFGLCAGVGFYVVQQALTSEERLETTHTSNVTNQIAAEGTVTSTSINNNEKQTVTVVDSDITSVVQRVMPAMVSIGNEFTERYSYFGQTFSQEAQSAGSGIIVGENDTELLVVTNYHVIENADKLTVTFIDNTEAVAQLKGADAGMDLAVLAVQLSELSNETRSQVLVAALGDSDNLSLGEPVIAIGNALGYGQSVTDGIVSALNREIELSTGQMGTFIQTNAAINPGNSGGALLNIEGEVIGINSNKIGGDAIEGMGYAIPISAAEPIIAELMLKETKIKVSEDEVGYIGIQPATVTEEISQLYGMPKGVYITQVIEGTPAEKAGLMQGDIITEIDGNTITSYEDLQEEMLYHAIGSTVEITVQRNTFAGYQEMKFDILLASRER